MCLCWCCGEKASRGSLARLETCAFLLAGVKMAANGVRQRRRHDRRR